METSATATKQETDPQVAVSSIDQRIKDLRKQAKRDPAGAQKETWSWIKKLGKQKAEAELGALYKLGQPPKGLDGPTDGILVTPLIQPGLDTALKAITKVWMPWQGKRFDSKAERGDNRLAGSARWPAKLLWPLYRTRSAESGRLAFDFETKIEPGKADPEIKVLKIDYAPVEENPNLVIRKIRDELVELVPDTYLGKILYKQGEGDEERYTNIGYFALRQPAG